MTRSLLRQTFALLAFAILPALLCGFFHPRKPAWSEEKLAPGEILLQTALAEKEKVLWLDARPAADFQKAHIPGALSLNEDDWDNLLPPVLDAWDRDKVIVVYCSSLQCNASEAVAKRLRENAKLPQVYVLKGGWESWQAAQK